MIILTIFAGIAANVENAPADDLLAGGEDPCNPVDPSENEPGDDSDDMGKEFVA